MKDSNNILDSIGRHDGMTVPPGFFEEFAVRMEASLPERPEAEHPATIIPHKTVWGRIRPYVYMAAMFGGIWCMLKMFTLMTSGNVDLSIDNNRVITEALGDDNFVYDYIINDINDREIFDEMFDDSISVEEMMQVGELPDGMPDADTELVDND